jgi:hypothetical protein
MRFQSRPDGRKIMISPHKSGIPKLWKILWETFSVLFKSFANICVIAVPKPIVA